MTCAQAGCERPSRTRGFCHRHYEARRRNGEIARVRITDPVARLWSYVDRTATCWLWTGAKSTGGYGRIYWSGKLLQAHRVVYELERGPIPDGLELDHLCRVRSCVNPDHLEPVTSRENLLRGVGASAANARRTACENGHEFTPENTYRWRGTRGCKTCRADATARRVRAHPPRQVSTATCVMCGTSFEFVRGSGGGGHRVTCSDACQAERRRQSAREHMRRRRAALRAG